MMLTTEKLEQVGKALEALTHAEMLVAELADDEPTQQPPTARRVELDRIANLLTASGEALTELWS